MTIQQIEEIFTYHAPKGDQQQRYVALCDKAKELALLIQSSCPESREKSLAITQLQLCTMMANSATAVNEVAPLVEPSKS